MPVKTVEAVWDAALEKEKNISDKSLKNVDKKQLGKRIEYEI